MLFVEFSSGELNSADQNQVVSGHPQSRLLAVVLHAAKPCAAATGRLAHVSETPFHPLGAESLQLLAPLALLASAVGLVRRFVTIRLVCPVNLRNPQQLHS